MVCLDFDGVLFDSAKEAFVIGCETFFGVDSNYDNSRVNYERFLLLRPFVDSAWQYRVVFNILNDDLNDELMLLEAKQKLKREPQKKDLEFAVKFNYIRTELLNNNRAKWINLNEPYAFFKLLKPLIIKFPDQFYICSTKGSEFIFEILSSHGVNIDIRQIWGKDIFEANNSSKAKILENNVNKQDAIIFVDDSPRHIEDVQCLKNVEAILAKWGYLEVGKIEDNHVLIVEKIRELLANNEKKN